MILSTSRPLLKQYLRQKGKKLRKTYIKALRICNTIHGILQTALGPMIRKLNHETHQMSFQIMEAKSAAIRQIAVARVLEKLQITPWSRLYPFNPNNVLLSHVFRTRATKAMRTLKTRVSMKMRKMRKSRQND
jgi:hypothetical protein